MNNHYKWSFVYAVGIVVYITVVATIMQNGEKLFGKDDDFMAPIAFLLLFTLSASVVGLLGLGKPVSLYLDGKKKDAVTLLVLTIGWIGIFTIFALITSALVK